MRPVHRSFYQSSLASLKSTKATYNPITILPNKAPAKKDIMQGIMTLLLINCFAKVSQS